MTVPEIVGYDLQEVIYQGTTTTLYRARSQADQQSVILKVLPIDHPAQGDRLRHEYAIIADLDLPHVIKVHRLETQAAYILLVLEDMQGQSLKQWLTTDRQQARQQAQQQQAGDDAQPSVSPLAPLSITHFLGIAVQLAKALVAIHQQQIIHRDIKPSNIIIDPRSGLVKLADFSIASRSRQEPPHAPQQFEGTMAYMSPEQTGRMNRTIDHRSDFYSLGVTFYELLTGELPFQNSDPLALVACHLAQQPCRVRDLNPTVPAPIALIVNQLMAKHPDDRYHNAAGLLFDLEQCLHTYKATGTMPDLVVGARDRAGQFTPPTQLYGRAQAVTTFLSTLDEVNQGRNALLVIKGAAGMGKTALLQALYTTLTRRQRQGYMIAGNFEPASSEVPLVALAEAHSSLIQQILIESETHIAAWCDRCQTALGKNGQIIVDLIPALELIIGPQPALPALEPTAAQQCYVETCDRFWQVISSPAAPLTLLMDDAQWGDKTSLQTLARIVRQPQITHRLTVLAYDDAAIAPTHPLITTLNQLQAEGIDCTTLTLTPLALTDITQWVAQTLSSPPDAIATFAQWLHAQTQGYPGPLKQLCQLLYDNGQLCFDYEAGRWQWDLDSLPQHRSQQQYNGSDNDSIIVKSSSTASPMTSEEAARHGTDVDQNPANQANSQRSSQRSRLSRSKADLEQPTVTKTANSTSSTSEILDLATVIKAAQAIASEIVLERLLDKLLHIILENVAAQTGCIILERDQTLYIEVADTNQRITEVVLQSVPVQSSQEIPQSLIQYVARTQQPVVFANAVEEDLMAADPYIVRSQSKSILCSPILYQGKFLGLVYLENNLVTGAFTHDRLELIQVLTAQAAIAIENATLYAQAQSKSQQLAHSLAQLQASEVQFRQLFEGSADAITLTNRDGFVDCNIAAVKMMGCQDKAQLLMMHPAQFSPEYQPDGQSSFEKANEMIAIAFQRGSHRFEWVHQRQHGEDFWAEVVLTLVSYQAQNVLHSTIREIGDRKQAEADLMQSEQRFRDVTEAAGEYIWETDAKGKYIFVTDKVTWVKGYAPDQLLGHTLFEFMPAEDVAQVEAVLQRVAVQKCAFKLEHRNITPTGKIVWEEVNGLPIVDANGEIVGFRGAGLSITDRKQAEAALQQSEARNRAILSALPDLMFGYNAAGIYVDFFPSTDWDPLISPDVFLKRSLFDVLPQDVANQTLAAIKQALATREMQLMQYQLTFDNGIRCDYEARLVAYGQDQVLQIVRDISVQKQAERQQLTQAAIAQVLVQSETIELACHDLLPALCQNLSWELGELWQVNPATNTLQLQQTWNQPSPQLDEFTQCSQAFEFPLGKGLPGRVWASQTPLWIPSVDQDERFLRSTAVQQAQLQSAVAFPILLAHSTYGVVVLFAHRNQPPHQELLQMLAGVGIHIGQFIDRKITETAMRQKSQELEQALVEVQQAQMQMVQSEKMSALGNLVAGVAHEINNPIGFLNGSIKNAQEYAHDLLAHLALYQRHYAEPAAAVLDHADEIDLEYLTADLPKLLQSMQGATDRIKGISTSLRNFSRADTEHKVIANLHDGIDSTLLILKYRLKANEYRPEIVVQRTYGELPQIECFPGQLNQVFMNILANAIDAIDEAIQPQTLTSEAAKAPAITVTTRMDANHIAIHLRDNGPGMPEAVQAKIFEHLYTTKGVGKGTGLGLSIARQIIESTHGGTISVNSTVGEGTEFVIQLPLPMQAG
jgi:two-component system, NtrC family, sensor kinase